MANLDSTTDISSRPKWKWNYTKVYCPCHPKASASGMVFEHILIAEKALGKLMPPKAQIHHVDANGRNNANTNLVICEDAAYHKLLHRRERAKRAGFNFDTEKRCIDCHQIKLKNQFRSSIYGRRCRECDKVRDRARWPAKYARHCARKVSV